ncbi:TetR/AcrR family transcriptional regulator [Methanogenium sp. MK-MG]|uniref:TetR/AcrR family transcriptional regulator n=1 Tax=Methanogenium sp. MK-MG TaxID=2599926 RepID=UPI0013EB0056|nr:TetR/AcrR family transcriptional regulator [Methanogenium sp. MK-MG]
MPKVIPAYKEEVRRKILRAAYLEAKEKGHHSLRMEDIAARLGISKGTIYLYFTNKHELSREVIQCIIRRFSEAIARTPDEDLHTTISNIYENTVHPGIFGKGDVMFDFFPLAARDPEVKKKVTTIRKEVGSAIESFIRDQQKRGTIDPALDTARSALMVQAASLGVQKLAATGVEEPEIREIWEGAVFRILGISHAEPDVPAPFISPQLP